MSFWSQKHVLVTGGASFIGSHLVDSLVYQGAKVVVADNMSSGTVRNIEAHLKSGKVVLKSGDLRLPDNVGHAMDRAEIVFHLAADHGGRGYVATHQSGPSTNMIMDGLVCHTAADRGIKVVFASSGCVYPNSLQSRADQELYLTEDMVGPPYEPDNMYGWAKLSTELVLKALHEERNLPSVSLRYFTVYGPRGKEDHAVIAMIARAFTKQSPFQVWGDGTQIRNWTYVDDIVEGTILAAEKVDDARAINLGTMERIGVGYAADLVLNLTHQGNTPIEWQPDMPTGPLNRVADNRLARELLGWEPITMFADGLAKTIEWYFKTKDRAQVSENLDRLLMARR